MDKDNIQPGEITMLYPKDRTLKTLKIEQN